MIKSYRWILLCLILVLPGFKGADRQETLYRISEGKISFVSEAPLELIQASSTQLKGAIDPAAQTFAFSVQNESFAGFNSALQREHFNENYMESSRYPTCSFSGKIIEPIDFSANGTYTVRAKGKLKAHGVEQERIIKSTLIVSNGSINISSKFTVALEDHNITIPKIVHQKIAEQIHVEINAILLSQQK